MEYIVGDNESIYGDSFGVLCEHHIFPQEGDTMWELGRIFLIVGLSLGSLTAALSWSVASLLTPTNTNWNGISVLAAATAVAQVPLFVLFEAVPCMGEFDLDNILAINGGKGEEASLSMDCRLGPGSYMLVARPLVVCCCRHCCC